MPRVPHRRTRRPPVLALFITLALLAAAGVSVIRADPRRIYLANDDHTDYFWSGDDVQYRAAFLSMLDFYMTQAETTAGRPPDQRGRFNCDGSLWVWEYERHKPAPAFDRLIGHLRDGTITMPLNNAALCYGAMPVEAVLRSMYYAGRLERRHGLRFPLVHAMENQTLPGGIASLWAGAGARYSWRGVCGCATKTAWGNRPREIYRFLGPDSTGVVLKWNTKPGPGYVLGGYAEARRPTEVVKYLDSDPAFLARWPWPVSAAFGHGEDQMQSTVDSFLVAAQRLSTPERRVIVSNQVDFFEDFLAHHGDDLQNFSGAFGNEWDLYQASMGAVTGAFRRGVEKLRTGEALATIASLRDPAFMAGREAARDAAFMAAGLFHEHNWTADGPVARTRRAQFQRDMLAQLQAYVDPLHADGLAALGAAIVAPAGVERHAVFNPLSWSRTDVAELTVTTPEPFHVVDVATGQPVPAQILGNLSGARRVRIRAAEVPSVGYRVYEVRPGAGPVFPPAATVAGAAVDNGFYRVTLGGRGEITSLLDRRNGDRQLVQAGGALHDLGTGTGNVTVEAEGPVSVTLRVAAHGPPRHETRVTLHAGLDRVDVEGLVTQNFSSTLAYRSAFALPGAVMRHEEIGMIARVARAAQGGDYADQNTRTDWLTFQHFVDLSQADYGVTVSNAHSPFFQAGNSTVGTLDGTTPTIAAVVGMQVDGPNLGIPDQGGDSEFPNHFAFRTHGAYDPAAAMRFALEHQNPLVATPLTGTQGSLPADTWSLVSLPDPDLLLWSLKPAEEGIGSGIVARVWNLAEVPRTLALSLPPIGVLSATRVTHVETDLGPASVTNGTVGDLLRRQQIATYRLVPGFPPPPPPPLVNLTPSVPVVSPDTLRDTTSVTVAFALRNTGTSAAPLSRWTLLVDGAEAAGGDTTVAASDSVAIACTLVPFPAGTHTLRVVADTLGQIAETDESDNAVAGTFTVLERVPTPPVATLLAPASGFAAFGDTLALEGAAADAEDPTDSLRVRWEIEALRTGDAPAIVFTDSVTPSSWIVPHGPDSTGIAWHVRWIVTDPGGRADTASADLLPEVDLSPSEVSTSPTPAQDGLMLICSFRIRNLGRMPAPATRWMLTVDDVRVEEGVEPIAAFDSVSLNCTLPPGALAPGVHVLRLVVDTLGWVPEPDESNNAQVLLLPVESYAPTGVEAGVPRVLRLSGARPNPGRGQVSFALELPHEARVRWRVHDLAGRVVWSEERTRAAGVWTLRWDRVDAAGRRLPPGVYLARVEVGDTRFTRRMVLE